MHANYNTTQQQLTTANPRRASKDLPRRWQSVQGRAKQPLTVHARQAYALAVTANSVTGFSGPIIPRRTSAVPLTAGAFFVPAVRVYGSCAWETERSAGFLGYRSANLRTAATLNRLAAVRGSSTIQGAPPMKLFPARNPSSHAEAWKARAMAALRSDSSLSVRLSRYNAAMSKARALEALASPSRLERAGGAV